MPHPLRRPPSRGSLRVDRIAEEIRRPPEHFDAGALLQILRHRNDGFEVFTRLGERRPFRRDVPVVEAVLFNAEFLQ